MVPNRNFQAHAVELGAIDVLIDKVGIPFGIVVLFNYRSLTFAGFGLAWHQVSENLKENSNNQPDC